MAHYPKTLQTLIAYLQKLPGVGRKTATRYAFQIISCQESEIADFTKFLSSLKEQLYTCRECGALLDQKNCYYCDTTRRDASQLCIISSPKDLFSIEATHSFNGMYHVLPGLLSPLDDIEPESLNLETLKTRIEKLGVQEIILALDSTIEGDATSLFLKKDLEKLSLSVTRLALGMPLGSTLDFLDAGTLSKALSSRSPW